MALVTVTDATFDAKVVDAAEPVLALFWAEWSGACMMMKSELEEISVDYAGRLTVAALNIDSSPATLPRYQETAIPAMLLFENGAVVAKKIGPHSDGQMREFLDSLL
ncbi:thioredoxin family protein [Streptomyces sp. NPDC048462]|uniref:thioredoxin family protein n=1 Tax=Streptomyces sp. NPDC048462 TaxID=3365555 RepID=UPI0037145DC1